MNGPADARKNQGEDHTMKLKHWLPLLSTALLCGCLQVEDQLTIAPDSSGTVRLEVRSAASEEMSQMLAMGSPFGRGAGGNLIYPPTSEAEARKWFPAPDFTLKTTEKSDGEERTLVLEASFKDVNKLLASQYGRAHQLTLKVEGGALKLQALSGAESVARAMNLKGEGELADYLPPGTGDLEKKKAAMKFKFRVTLPNALVEANGAKDGPAATWSVERAACKDDEDFAAKLGGVLTASCAADGLKFSPVAPPRLALGAFGEVAAGQYAGTTPLPDTNQVASAVKFVPYSLRLKRTVDLSGEGGEGSQAQLAGAFVVPAALAPAQWGQPKLLEVLDAKGQSLLPKEDGEGSPHIRRFSHMDSEGGDENPEDAEGEAGAPKAKPTDDVRREVALSFRAPDWKVKTIKSLKAAVPMQYLSGSEVIKFSNAVPAKLVMDMTKQTSSRSFGGEERGAIEHPRLTELGLSVRVQMAMVQGTMTVISLQTSGGKQALVDAQVYDAEGKAWPTALAQDNEAGEEERSAQLMVTGKPKPPFSLALVWGGVGATVEAPIRLENIPLTGK
jgi:hypothetical protein